MQNAYLIAKIGADTAENEPKFAKLLAHFATQLGNICHSSIKFLRTLPWRKVIYLLSKSAFYPYTPHHLTSSSSLGG